MKSNVFVLLASIMVILIGVFQIKRKDTDTVLSFFGMLEIIMGSLLAIITLGCWNCFE